MVADLGVFCAFLGANLMHDVPFWGTSLRQCVQEHVLELLNEFFQLSIDTQVYPRLDLLFPFLNTEETFFRAEFFH